MATANIFGNPDLTSVRMRVTCLHPRGGIGDCVVQVMVAYLPTEQMIADTSHPGPG
jgi:hypothetical protein